MKILIKVLMFASLGMIVFNAYHVNWKSPFEGISKVGVIGIIASFCAFTLLLIVHLSIMISKKLKQ